MRNHERFVIESIVVMLCTRSGRGSLFPDGAHDQTGRAEEKTVTVF